MSFFKSLFGSFFNKELVYTAFNNEDYFKVVAKLKSSGIKFTIKNLIRHSDTPSPLLIKDHNKAPVHYEIYVKKEDADKASWVIRQK